MSTINGPGPPGPGPFKRLWKRVRHPSGASDVVDITKSALVVAKEAAPGPSKSAIAGVVALWDAAERINGTKERACELDERTKGLIVHMLSHPGGGSDGTCVAVDVPQFLNTLEERNQGIEPILGRSRIAGLMHLNRDEKKVADTSRRFDEEVNDIQALLSVNIQTQVINTHIEVTKLGKDVDNLRFLVHDIRQSLRHIFYMNIAFFGLF